jgi:hypothetical protein
MNNPNPEEQASQVKAALFAGNKIQAIKLYREQTGLGLAESKNAVEKLEAELRASSPGQFSKPPAAGCASLIAATVTLVLWRIFA